MKKNATSYAKELNDLLLIAETESDLKFVQALIAEYEKATADGGQVLSSETVGKVLGVSDRTVRRWWERGCPRDSIDTIRQWRLDNIKKAAEGADASEITAEMRLHEMMDKAESARTRRLKNDLLEGRLVPRAEVERDTAICLARLRNGLAPLGSMCANICPAEVKAVVADLVDNAVKVRVKEVADSMRLDEE